MEYIGWDTPCWGVFSNNSPKQILAIRPSQPNFFRRAASFKLRMTMIGQAVLQLFDSTFMLEISFPPQKEGVFGA
jgi:hypothetical protein